MADDKKTDTTSASTDNASTSGTSITTPSTPSWLTSLYQGLASQGTSLMNGGASAYTPEASSALQTTAENNAAGLSGVGTGNLAQALQAASGMTSLTAPTYTAAQAATPSVAPAATYGATGYNPTSAAAVNVAPVANISGSQLSTDDIQRLFSPYLTDVVNSSTDLFDKQAGEDQTSLDAQAGLNSGAFGSSGYALQKSNLTGSQALARSNIQSNLLNQGFNSASTLAAGDADRDQTASVANQATAEQSAVAQAQIDSAKSLADQNAANSAGQFAAGALNTAGQFNASSINTVNQLIASLKAQTSLANAGATNTASQSNQTAQVQTWQQQLAAILGAGSLSTQANSTAATDAALQAQLGGTQYSQDVAAQQFPLTLLQQIAQIASGLPVSALSGSTTTQDGTTTDAKTGTGTSNVLGIGITGAGIGPTGGFSITGG